MTPPERSEALRRVSVVGWGGVSGWIPDASLLRPLPGSKYFRRLRGPGIDHLPPLTAALPPLKRRRQVGRLESGHRQEKKAASRRTTVIRSDRGGGVFRAIYHLAPRGVQVGGGGFGG